MYRICGDLDFVETTFFDEPASRCLKICILFLNRLELPISNFKQSSEGHKPPTYRGSNRGLRFISDVVLNLCPCVLHHGTNLNFCNQPVKSLVLRKAASVVGKSD